jgi:hypothetical protein
MRRPEPARRVASFAASPAHASASSATTIESRPFSTASVKSGKSETKHLLPHCPRKADIARRQPRGQLPRLSIHGLGSNAGSNLMLAATTSFAVIAEGLEFRAIGPNHKITLTLPASQVGFDPPHESRKGRPRCSGPFGSFLALWICRKCDTRGHRRSPDPGCHPPANA